MKRLALLLLVSCRTPSSSSADATTNTVTSASAAPSASVASVDAGRAKRPKPRDIVDRWNEAHTKHDSATLQGLYAPTVQFYGQTLSGKKCADLKKAAFVKSPDYAQSIKDVTVEQDGSQTKVSFTKTSTEKGKSTDYPAFLYLTRDGLISAESDKITDANLAKAATVNADWCLDTSEPTLDSIATEKVIPPYKISSMEARKKANASKLFQDMAAATPNDFVVIDIISCPTKCTQDDCGYTMRVANHSNIDKYPSIMVGWLYVDARDGTVKDTIP